MCIVSGESTSSLGLKCANTVLLEHKITRVLDFVVLPLRIFRAVERNIRAAHVANYLSLPSLGNRQSMIVNRLRKIKIQVTRTSPWRQPHGGQ